MSLMCSDSHSGLQIGASSYHHRSTKENSTSGHNPWLEPDIPHPHQLSCPQGRGSLQLLLAWSLWRSVWVATTYPRVWNSKNHLPCFQPSAWAAVREAESLTASARTHPAATAQGALRARGAAATHPRCAGAEMFTGGPEQESFISSTKGNA